MAVGVAVQEDKFTEFKNLFLKIANEAGISKIQPLLNIDEIIDIDEIDKDMVESISILEPFGDANKMPIFAFKNLKIDSIRSLSEGKHLKLVLKSNKILI